MDVKLGDIAEIQIGYQSRGGIKPDPDGTHRIIQMKDFDDNNKLNVNNLYKIKPRRKPDNYLVSKGDILFAPRGRYNYAAEIQTPLANTIAASSFYILRVESKNILPGYLAWLINQNPVQRRLKKMARGTFIPMIPKYRLADIKIQIPDIETQNRIVALIELSEKEHSLTMAVIERKNKLVRTICLGAVKGENQQERNDYDESS